jgi:hypothetical protein
MIRDRQGRKWRLRFTQYQDGWRWEAKHEGCGVGPGPRAHKTRELALADAERTLTTTDIVAISRTFARLAKGKSLCQLTPADRACRKGRPRIDLNGIIDGHVTEEEELYARGRVAELLHRKEKIKRTIQVMNRVSGS